MKGKKHTDKRLRDAKKCAAVTRTPLCEKIICINACLDINFHFTGVT